ncbi:MAG: hypothetical protein JXO44_11615 [Clostridia bacterium]|nr:hypothetical protein [Clostridia bacterium]
MEAARPLGYPYNADVEYHNSRLGKVDKLHTNYREGSEKHLRAKRIAFFLKATLGIIAVFGCLSLIVYRYAMINEVKYNIYSLQKEVNALNITIEELNTKLDGSIVLDKIEQEAIDELGMQYPQPEQIVYLNSHWNYSLDDDETVVIATNDVEKPLIDESTVNRIKSFAVKIDDVINK